MAVMDEFREERERMKTVPCYGEDYTLRKKISPEKRKEQKDALSGKIGFVD